MGNIEHDTTMPASTTVQNVRPEEEILFCCALVHMDESTATRLATLLGQDVDWERLQTLAHQHFIEQLV